MGALLKFLGGVLLTGMAFVGLVHGILLAQHKHTPESVAVFHDWPVMGGFFPRAGPAPMPPATPEDLRDLRAAAWLEETRRDYELPPGFSATEITTLLADLRDRRRALDAEVQKQADERALIARAAAELQEQREALARDTDAFVSQGKAIQNDKNELDRRKSFYDAEQDKSVKKLASMYASMTPEDAGKKLAALDDDSAARLVSQMDERKAGKVLGQMDTLRSVEIFKRMRELSPRFKTAAAPAAAAARSGTESRAGG